MAKYIVDYLDPDRHNQVEVEAEKYESSESPHGPWFQFFDGPDVIFSVQGMAVLSIRRHPETTDDADTADDG